jgi:hypothetical protein
VHAEGGVEARVGGRELAEHGGVEAGDERPEAVGGRFGGVGDGGVVGVAGQTLAAAAEVAGLEAGGEVVATSGLEVVGLDVGALDRGLHAGHQLGAQGGADVVQGHGAGEQVGHGPTWRWGHVQRAMVADPGARAGSSPAGVRGPQQRGDVAVAAADHAEVVDEEVGPAAVEQRAAGEALGDQEAAVGAGCVELIDDVGEQADLARRRTGGGPGRPGGRAG